MLGFLLSYSSLLVDLCDYASHFEVGSSAILTLNNQEYNFFMVVTNCINKNQPYICYR